MHQFLQLPVLFLGPHIPHTFVSRSPPLIFLACSILFIYIVVSSENSIIIFPSLGWCSLLCCVFVIISFNVTRAGKPHSWLLTCRIPCLPYALHLCAVNSRIPFPLHWACDWLISGNSILPSRRVIGEDNVSLFVPYIYFFCFLGSSFEAI